MATVIPGVLLSRSIGKVKDAMSPLQGYRILSKRAVSLHICLSVADQAGIVVSGFTSGRPSGDLETVNKGFLLTLSRSSRIAFYVQLPCRDLRRLA